MFHLILRDRFPVDLFFLFPLKKTQVLNFSSDLKIWQSVWIMVEVRDLSE